MQVHSPSAIQHFPSELDQLGDEIAGARPGRALWVPGRSSRVSRLLIDVGIIRTPNQDNARPTRDPRQPVWLVGLRRSRAVRARSGCAPEAHRPGPRRSGAS